MAEDAQAGGSETGGQEAGAFQALGHFASFQRRTAKLRAAADVEAVLDLVEGLLDEEVEFSFLRTYFCESDGEMGLKRAICPDEIATDWEVVRWAMEKGEVALVPSESGTEGVRNQLLLPLVGGSGKIGIILLWVNFDLGSFTMERRTVLDLLAREAASALESLRLRQEVERARLTLALAVESIPMGILTADAEGRLSLINGTAEVLFSIRRDASMGKLLRDLFPAQTSGHLTSLAADGPGQDEVEVDLHVVGQDQPETIGISCAPLPGEEEGKPGGHVYVCRNLKLTREVAKLRQLDAMKNDFLGLVSHELRTPLTSIMAYSETLLMPGMVESEQERKEYLEIIQSEGKRLCRLINDVLDLTKMESGKMEYHFEQVDLNTLVRTSFAGVRSLAEQKSITIEYGLDLQLPKVKADPDRITQVLTNVYSNAIKFTAEGGKLTAKSCVVKSGDATQAQVSITDTGIGIKPEDIHKVFSKFEQIEHIDHHSVGTGLGMPICAQIIESGHGGRIWIESQLGVGTTIFFALPVN